MSLLEFAAGLTLGLGIAGGLYLWLWRQSRRHRPPPTAKPESTDASARSETLPPEPPGGAAYPGELPPRVATGPAADPEPVPASAEAAETPVHAPAPARARGPATPPSTLRLSQRVILHVYGQGTHVPGEVAAPGLCQAGMVDALGVPQAGLAAVLRRLEAAGVLVGEKGHVRGHDRRLKVYRLTSKGLELARELRGRTRRAPGR